MKTSLFSLLAALAGVSLLVSVPASAQTGIIYTNFAPGGGLPGGSVISSGIVAGWTDSPTVASLVLSGNVTAGSTYWLVGEAPLADSSGSWQLNLVGDQGGYLYRDTSSGSGWLESAGSQRPAFQVNGFRVPEPGTLALLAFGSGAGLAVRRRYRSR